ncbi:maleylpyruvate isomerase N-terminal domain-containing protein [Streptomyces sp. WP-1]|uniref:maleylpyruvate isomerase N-terminal domain-containing protein n=1 Tax=Streptomyces sp. WP-1 TaxID=3041497 RepID=UPI00351BA10D
MKSPSREPVASGADLSATVPTCPERTLQQLVRHTGGALRWSGTLVRERAQEMIPWDRIPLRGGPEEQGDPVSGRAGRPTRSPPTARTRRSPSGRRTRSRPISPPTRWTSGWSWWSGRGVPALVRGPRIRTGPAAASSCTPPTPNRR